MNGKMRVYINQYNQCFWAKSVKDLRKQVGGGRISKMYIDKTDGSTKHVGYVIGMHWLTAYMPFEQAA